MFFNPYYGAGYTSTDTILLMALLLVMILGFVAQSRVTGTFQKYAKVQAKVGMRGHRAAQDFLNDANSSARLTRVSGTLTDHFNPRTNVVGLSDAVYDSSSVAALAVAAHEIGHVMQYEEGYFPIKLRNAILPVANFGSRAAPLIVLIGFFMGSFNLALIGVVLFGAMFLFQLFTLPVEFNASSRAIEMLTHRGYLTPEEVPQAKAVLRAAALTYVVGALASLVTLLRLLSMANRSRR